MSIIKPDDRPGKSGPGTARLRFDAMFPDGPPRDEAAPHTPPADARISAFAALAASADRHDGRAALAAIRELRRLGYSVCLIQANPAGGGH